MRVSLMYCFLETCAGAFEHLKSSKVDKCCAI